MLKTNSKAAREKIRAYIMENYNVDGYDDDTPEASASTFQEVATVILSDLKRVKGHKVKAYTRYSWQDAFYDYSSGLPSLVPYDYFLHSAVDILGDILEETEAEKARFKESDAEKTIAYLIYRELIKAAPGVLY